ncbi:MAG: alpha/beta hydrolase [Idiomarina sp.]|nr:alpha/beta hydrolase [Idiomarina sp.]
MQGYAGDLLDVIECLNLQQPYLLSHSASGSIGVLAELTSPGTFKRMLMISPSPRYINDGNYQGGFEKEDVDSLLELMEENYFQWANVMAAQAMKNEQRPELAERLIRSFQQARPDIMLAFARAILYSDYREQYARVDCPVSILQTTDDSIVPMTVADYLQAHMRQCTVQTIAASGHYPQLSHPADVVEQVRHILAKEIHE